MKNDKTGKKPSVLLNLFFTMLKIGLFTFGGGYAMLALLEDEFVTRKNWLTDEEFLNMTAISESTPGPIAINSSTFIGYKVKGVWGSIVATLGICIPSFAIILAISLIFEAFLSFGAVSNAFRGIRACVVYLILSAGIKMLKGIKKDKLSLILFVVTLVSSVCLYIFSVDFSSIFYILIGGAVGVLVYAFSLIKSNKKTIGGSKK